MPFCHACDIKMAVHMDDPPWDIFGLPRLLVDAESIDRFLKMVDAPYSCLTLCSGFLNANPANNVAEIVGKHVDRIAFAHIRNVRHFPKEVRHEYLRRIHCEFLGSRVENGEYPNDEKALRAIVEGVCVRRESDLDPLLLFP